MNLGPGDRRAPAEPLLDLLRFLAAGAGPPAPALAARLSEAVTALLADPEWQILAPLAAARLREAGATLDSGTGAALGRAAAAAVAVAMARRRVLMALGERASGSGMAFLLLKGAALTGWVYPWDAPRLGVDLDVLIAPEDGDRVAGVLAGLATEEDKFPGRPHLRRLAYERSFRVRAPLGVDLDVHLGLAYPALYCIDYPGLWRRSRPHPAYGRAGLRVPDPEDMLLHLAIHCLYDLKTWGRHDLDAALLIAQGPIDWPRLAQRARDWGAGVGLFLLLERLARGLGLAVPGPVLAGLRPGAATLGGARLVLVGVAREDLGSAPGAVRWRQLAAQLWLTQRTTAVLRFQAEYALARLCDALSRGV